MFYITNNEEADEEATIEEIQEALEGADDLLEEVERTIEEATEGDKDENNE